MLLSRYTEPWPGALPPEGRRRVLFVGGKGGVGKTTVAGALALAAAERGERVLLVSTDPAHSLAHLFGTPVGGRPRELAPRLHALEIDADEQVDRYLAHVGDAMRTFVRPALYAEVDRQIELARHAPGAVEAALLERVADIMDAGPRDHDRVIFDTAPTGHTLRLLALPEIMQAWTEGLLRSRERAGGLRAALKRLTRRRGPAGDVEPDGPGGSGPEAGEDLGWLGDADDAHADARERRIRDVLLERRRLFLRARRILLDSEACGFLLVVVPERLPILESRAALDVLRRHGIPVLGLVVNRVLPADADDGFLARRRAQEAEYLAEIEEAFADLPRVPVPLMPSDVHGADALREVARHLAPAG